MQNFCQKCTKAAPKTQHLWIWIDFKTTSFFIRPLCFLCKTGWNLAEAIAGLTSLEEPARSFVSFEISSILPSISDTSTRCSLKIHQIRFLTFWFFPFKDSIESSSSSSLIVADWTLEIKRSCKNGWKPCVIWAIWIICYQTDLAVVAPVDVCDTFDEDPEKFRWYPPGPRPTECLQKSFDECPFTQIFISNTFRRPSRSFGFPPRQKFRPQGLSQDPTHSLALYSPPTTVFIILYPAL